MNSSTQSQQDLGIKTLVMFDTETTGLPSPGNKSRIIELCFIALLKDELLSNYSEIRVMNKLLLCFNPHRRLGPGSSEITGLHNDALEAYGPFKSQANLISSFLKSLPQPACLIAHNGVRFDFPLLVSEFKRTKEEFLPDILCADSLEAFRELDGLPRIPDYVLKRKRNGSPQKANNSTVCPEMPGEQESPKKQPRPSSGEVNGWKIEEKTPEKRRYIDDAIKGQHSKCISTFSDPSGKSNGDWATNCLFKLFDRECIKVCCCNLKSVTCLNKRDESPSSCHGENTAGKSLPCSDVENFSSNGSPIRQKTIEQVKEFSYSLPKMYQRLFGQAPDNSHTAESDCLTLLKVIRCRKKEFYQWCNRNAVRLSTIEPMY